MKVTINVSKDNIRHGDVRDPANCIIQRAISEALPLAERVLVGIWAYNMTNIVSGTIYYNLQLPKQIAEFINRSLTNCPKYLRWIFLKPFSFELDVPDEFVAEEPCRGYDPSRPVAEQREAELRKSETTMLENTERKN